MLDVKIGTLAIVRQKEADELRALAREMKEATEHHMEPGWFLRYLTAHRASFRIIRGILRRSHVD